MNVTPALHDWHLGDAPNGQPELVGTLIGDPVRGVVPEFRTGPLVRFVGPRLIMTEDGSIYRLLPLPPERHFPPEIIARMGPASWRPKRPPQRR